jgi:eukaryotic-like serine/threonine-protein kinase
VKVMSDVLVADERYVERFAREARTAAGLSHPHLVQIYDSGIEGGRPFLVMEYVDGGTLGDRLRGEGGDPIDAQMLARELLDALGHVHAAGIVHRDVKPANVLIGQDGRVRLTDFGIAQSADATRLTQTGSVLGTLKYIAPELLRGNPATVQSDLYSLGVVLSELDASRENPRLERLIECLTTADPARRPASAQDALRLLDDRPVTEPTKIMPGRAGQTGPITAHPSGAGREQTSLTIPLPGRRTLRVHRRIAPAVGVGVVLLVLVIALSSGSGGRTSGKGSVHSPPANAPLNQQLDSLDREIDSARRR